MLAVVLILAHLVLSCQTMPITMVSTSPTGLNSTILTAQQFNAYKATKNGTIGYYGSCKGKKPGACRYPLECFETEETKTSKSRVDTHITGYCSTESKYCLCHSVRSASGCKKSSDCNGLTRCASFVVGNECVSCTASIPSFATYTDDGNGNCDSIKKTKSKNEGNSIILGEHFDKCFSGDNYTCTDGNICAEYPVFTVAKQLKCVRTDIGSDCEVINPMDIFQHCNDYKSRNCVCRPILTSSTDTGCIKSSDCPIGEKCMTLKGDSIFSSIAFRGCISCLVPEIPSNIQPADNGMGRCKTTKPKPSPKLSFPSVDSPMTSKTPRVNPEPSAEVLKDEIQEESEPSFPQRIDPEPSVGVPKDDKQEESGPSSSPISPTFPVSQTDDMETVPVASKGVEPTELPQDPDVSTAPCIAVSALSEFHPQELVYPMHMQSTVLCDQWKSCATPGHIVVFHDKAMMMQEYCRSVFGGCVRRIMLVNSPRINRKLRVKSMSPELQYTALSARYGSSAEKLILSWLIRYGM